jgi:8-oxo-dGTP pyrophosphatase MutT (NUDIX family)
VSERDADALFARAGDFDAAGDERAAVPLYREALAAGLSGESRVRAVIQLASSLRVLGDASGAIALLRTVPAGDPLAPAARAFLALALFDDEKPAAALQTALEALTPTLPAYRRSLDAYAAELAAPDRVRAIAVGLVVDDGWILGEEYPPTGRHGGFLRAPGGGIEFGESAVAALRREFAEELDAEVDEAHPLGVTENIFDAQGKRGHEIVHVFAVRSRALAALPRADRLDVRDSDTTVGWYRLADIRRGDLTFHPPGAVDLLG